MEKYHHSGLDEKVLDPDEGKMPDDARTHDGNGRLLGIVEAVVEAYGIAEESSCRDYGLDSKKD